jgi:hypothetical protein
MAEGNEELNDSVVEYVEAVDELKRFMMESKDVLLQLRERRKRLSEVKSAVLEKMEESGLETVSSNGIEVHLKPCKRVKHDVASLKRLAGDMVVDEYMVSVTEMANVVCIGRSKKTKNKKNSSTAN